MHGCQLSLLGPPILTNGSPHPIPLARTKARALLYYLAAHPGRTFSRPQLAQLLWEENDEAGGRHNLSTTLTRLRQMLPVWPLRVCCDEIGWDPAAPVQVDATAFLAFTRIGDMNALKSAVALWRGPFLDGFTVDSSEAYEQWLEEERAIWEQRGLTALEGAAREMLTSGDWDAAAQYARKALAIDPLQERFHRVLMAAAHYAGNRVGALSQFGQCQRLLKEHLGVGPDSATIALRDAILSGQMPTQRANLASQPAGGRAPAGQAQPHPAGGQAQPPPAEVAPSRPPFAGRTLELRQLQEAIASARHGTHRVIWLEGEAGSGKSGLLQEMVQGGARESASGVTLFARCFETTAGLAYAPLVAAFTALRPSLDLAHLALPEHWRAEVARLLPDVAVGQPHLPSSPSLPAPEARQRLFEGLARLVAGLPEQRLLVLDDIQWIDGDSLQLLAYLARHPLLARLVLLVASRTGELPEGVARVLRELERDHLLRHIRLEPLGEAAMAELVARLTGRADPRATAELLAETGGNLRFAVELLGPSSSSAPSDAVRDRLAGLPADARELITAASACPDPVQVSLLQRISGLTDDSFLAALDFTLGSGLLREAEPDASGPTVIFAHPLVRRVTWSDLSAVRRAMLLRRICQARRGLHSS